MNQAITGFALITGASSGIGAIYADRLAKRGHDLILVARRLDRLRTLADRIAVETGPKVEVISADLVKRKDLAKIEAVLRTDKRITTLVNDDGVASTTPLLQADVDKMSELIALNVDTLTRLTYEAAPGFVERGGGTIILAFGRSLKHEPAEKGVRVQVVLPRITATDLWMATDTPLKQMPRWDRDASRGHGRRGPCRPRSRRVRQVASAAKLGRLERARGRATGVGAKLVRRRTSRALNWGFASTDGAPPQQRHASNSDRSKSMIALSKLTTVAQRNVCDLSNVFITGSSAAYKSISTRLGRAGVT